MLINKRQKAILQKIIKCSKTFWVENIYLFKYLLVRNQTDGQERERNILYWLNLANVKAFVTIHIIEFFFLLLFKKMAAKGISLVDRQARFPAQNISIVQ